MQITEITDTIVVLGIELRTSNERAFDEIPAHWARFGPENVLGRIGKRLGDEVFAVYTNFEHPGIDNLGTYSLIIGGRVAAGEAVPAGMSRVVIAPARRAVFAVPTGRHDLVGECWREIWARTDLVKTYECDYERYQNDGRIDILVGVR